MTKTISLTDIADKEYIVRMLVGLIDEIMKDMNYCKEYPTGYRFVLLTRQLVTTVRMLEEIME